MAWTTPITWTSSLVTVAQFNEQIRDNFNYLLTPNATQIVRYAGANYSITNVQTLQDIDSTNLTVDLLTNGGHILIGLGGTMNSDINNAGAFFDFTLDGSAVGGVSGLALARIATNTTHYQNVEVTVLVTGRPATTYTIRPQWKSFGTGTTTLFATSGLTPVHFWAIEL